MNLRIILILCLFNIGFGEGILCAKEAPENIYPEIIDGLQLKSNKDEREDHSKAWLLFNQGEIEKALSIAKKYYYESRTQSVRWALLLGAIYFEQEKYEDALKSISIIRPHFEKFYAKVKNKKIRLKKDELKALKFLYYKMLLVSGVSNYELGNWESALKDLLEYSEEFQKPTVYEYIGIAYYQKKQYPKSIEYFKRSYHLHKEGELKDDAAFNIGALNAILGNVKEAIFWLKIPLGHNRQFWLKMIKEDEDKDFEAIRNNKQFEDFLKEQEKELEFHKDDKDMPKNTSTGTSGLEK